MTAEVTRPLGRPRDPGCDARILEATLGLLADGGYDGVTMEAVAARAGVGKATLYRRYLGKDAMIVDALATLSEPVSRVSRGNVRDDLVALLQATVRTISSPAGRLLPRLVSAAVDNPGLLERYRAQVVTPRRQGFADVLLRGVQSGELRADLDVEQTIDLLVGPVLYRSLLRPDEPPVPAAGVVDAVLSGITRLPRSTAR